MIDKEPTIIDFKSAKAVRDFVETANERIFILEDALYAVLDCDRLDIAKELAADALGEDLEIYLEADNCGVPELDFNGDNINIDTDYLSDEDKN